jgi:heme A synthase
MNFPELKFLPDTAAFIANVLVLSIVGLVFALVVTGKTDTDVFKVLVGALMSVGFTNIVGFYFGSSQGSKEKDTAITTMATTQAQSSVREDAKSPPS